GSSKQSEEVFELLKDHEIYRFCPEVEGGLPVPREPSELSGSAILILEKRGATAPELPAETEDKGNPAGVFTKSGMDVTQFFLKGAQAALELCLKEGIKMAVLKERSPSCGKHRVYDGTF